MKKSIALIGNPNSGKTTIFNMLTGTYQKVGNWTGVTTESKEGRFKYDKEISIVDLPGIYSLNATSPDEQVVIDYIKNNNIDLILNIIDANHLERSLSLTLSLLNLNIPTYIVLTHEKQFRYSGKDIDLIEFTKNFGLPISFVCPPKKQALIGFMERLVKTDKTALRGDFGVKTAQIKLEEGLKKSLIDKQTAKKGVWDKIDKVATNKFLALPIFFCVMLAVYYLSIKVGGLASSFIGDSIGFLGDKVENFLNNRGSPEWIVSLLCQAIIGGFGTVLSFLPQILVLFALVGVIEQSGYATRIAFILDRIFKGVSLSGKSVMPLVACSGCTATGLMCTRAIESVSDRRATIILSPFMPCGAKTAVFGWISYTFFNGNPFVAASMYFLSLFSVGVFGLVLKKLRPFRRKNDCFALEMPRLITPRLRDILLSLKEKTKDFLGKAALIVFLVSVVVWALKNLGFNGYTGGNVKQSFLFCIGQGIKWIFYPLGFGNWECSVAVLSGFFAKEAIIETLKIVSIEGNEIFSNGFAIYSFMAFILLSPPCVISLLTTYRELKSKKWFLFSLVFQFICAYITAFMINLIGILIGINTCLPFFAILGIILMIVCFCKIKRKGNSYGAKI